MTAPAAKRNVRLHQSLHGSLYAALVLSVVWTVAACWFFFSRELYTGLQVAVVTFFAAAFMATPAALWRLSGQTRKGDLTLRQWCDGELDISGGPIEAKHAAIMILIAPMAAAAGITAIGFVAALASRGML